MVDSICRALRDGGLEGEHAPTLTIKDSIDSPLGLDVFNHLLAQLSSSILSAKSQSQSSCLLLIAFARSPSFYVQLLKTKGVHLNSPPKRIHILDCYTDPLGWKSKASNADTDHTSTSVSPFKHVNDIDKLFCLVTELGNRLLGEIKGRFSVAVDSMSEMLRHAPLTSIASFISKLRTHDRVSSIFWSLHSDLHEPKVVAVFDYMSSMIAALEPVVQASLEQRPSSENIYSRDDQFRKGKLSVRLKKRNGRVRQMFEEIIINKSGIKFTPILSNGQAVGGGGPIAKVQFNLSLSEKEQMDRASVVLPFEHQGNGKTIEIYDGRRSLTDMVTEKTEILDVSDHHKGEIIYLRDSDDERPDSDEDPDDDLDI